MELCYTPFDQAAQALGIPVAVGEPMSRHTTFQIGGPADRFAAVETLPQLKALLQALESQGLPYLVLGKGSNLLVSDKGIRGAVLLLSGEFKAVTLLEDGLVRAGAGASLASVCRFVQEHSLTGLEFAWGIPGSVGGAAYMDAGAYGGEMKDVITHVTACLPDGRTVAYSNEEMDFGYRKSKINQQPEPIAITSVTVALTPADEETVRATMREFSARRREKQPLTLPSCGSTFKRPEGRFAGTLIEECGLKGCRVGGCSVSTLHAGFLVNDQQGSACDYLSLIAQVQKTVYEKTGVRLEPEVRIWGEDVCAKEI